MKNYITLICSCFFLANSSVAFTTDETLYAAPSPNDASFIRFIGFERDDVVVFADKEFTMKKGEADSFLPVSSALLADILEGSFYSLVKKTDGTVISILEARRDDPTKVGLTLLNGDVQSLRLGLTDASVTVVSDVEVSRSGHSLVNPIQIEFGVFNQIDQDPIARFDVALRRGQNITFFADVSGVRMIEDRFGATVE